MVRLAIWAEIYQCPRRHLMEKSQKIVRCLKVPRCPLAHQDDRSASKGSSTTLLLLCSRILSRYLTENDTVMGNVMINQLLLAQCPALFFAAQGIQMLQQSRETRGLARNGVHVFRQETNITSHRNEIRKALVGKTARLRPTAQKSHVIPMEQITKRLLPFLPFCWLASLAVRRCSAPQPQLPDVLGETDQ